MRYGIFSDVHSNLQALQAVVGAYKNESVDRYILAGDIVGYGADPKECIELIRSLCTVVIAGNHDWGCVNLLPADYFNPYARQALLWTQRNIDEQDGHFLRSLQLMYRNEDLTVVHATLNNPQDFEYMTDCALAEKSFDLMETDVCFIGHTHVPAVFVRRCATQDEGRGKKTGSVLIYQKDTTVDIKQGNKYIINAGSVGQPRDGKASAAYCIFDTDKRRLRIKRIGYDVVSARSKIINQGLPSFLGDRLIAGR